MRVDYSKWLSLSAIVLIVACAETKNLPKAGKLSASVIRGGDCSAPPPSESGSRGIVRLDAIKNYTKGRLEFRGKAFISSEDIAQGKSVSSLLGFVTRSQRSRKVLGKMKGANISPSLEVSLGSAVPSESQGATPLDKSDIRGLRTAAGLDDTKEDSSPVLVLQQVPEVPGLYLSDSVNPPSIPLSTLSSIKKTNQLLGGIGRYRSMVIEARGAGASAVMLPSDPEPSEEGKGYADSPLKNEKVGDPISVAIAPDDNKRPADTDSKIVVKLFEKSSNPTSLQTCISEDPSSGGAISVPTDKIKPGEYFAMVSRVYRMTTPMPDKKGSLIIETAVSVGAIATVADKPKDGK